MKLTKILAILLLTNLILAQTDENGLVREAGELRGGLGLAWIDGKPHYAFRFTPEFTFSKLGVGLDLNLEFDSKGTIRRENFNEFSDYLSLLRYISYGQKKDQFYARLGALDYSTLGHGSVMYLYNNNPSFDARKIGVELDIDFEKFGFESVYGSFGEAGVFGLRGYIHPLKYTSLETIPIISNFQIGATYACDFHEYAGVINGVFDTINKTFVFTKDEGSINIIGFDMGLPIISSDAFGVEIYADYAKIIKFGSGVATGIKFDFNAMGALDVNAKLERRFNNGKFIPSYFNSFYEIERFNAQNSSFISKAQILEKAESNGNGFYGELQIGVIGAFNILGSYQRLDKEPKSGILHLMSNIAPKDASYIARIGYDKINIEDEKDMFTLDERSYLYAEAGYRPLPFIIFSLIYHWTFSPIRDAEEKFIGYEPQKRIEPRLSFVIPMYF